MLTNTIKEKLEANDIEAAGSFAARDRKVMSRLIRLAYAKDTLVGWRAILAVGIAAREMVKTDAAFLRETCRKLLWSLSDESGGIGWSAPELLGEIVSADPKGFEDLVPLIASAYEVEEDVFRPGVLYALGQIAEEAPELAAAYQRIIIRSLSDKEALVRIRGIRLVGLLWPYVKSSSAWSQDYCERVRSSLEGLRKDNCEAWVYGETGFESVLANAEAEKTLKIIT